MLREGMLPFIDKVDMYAFFSTQLDFIFFFYGLAFILLGAICVGIARGGRQETPWRVLALFAFLHGASEWLDLLALIGGDSPLFAIFRTGLMTASFMVLLEFARLEGVRLGYKTPARWFYAPLLLVVVWGACAAGVNEANALARYVFGLPGALASAAVLAVHARAALPSERRWIIAEAIGFVLYGLAAGVIVPPVANWHGDFINYTDFSSFTGIPIQFVRGVLACAISLSIWGFWGQRVARDVASVRYTNFMNRQFVWTLVAMGAIMVGGWILTEYLGGIYKQNVAEAAAGDLDLIGSRLAGETNAIDGMVRVIAGERPVSTLLTGGDRRYVARVNSILSLDGEISGARNALVLDRAGNILASYSHNSPGLVGARDYTTAPYFQSALAGNAGYHFEVAGQGKWRDYYASFPVRDDVGEVIGVVVLVKSLDAFDADLQRFDTAFYLINAQGVVVVSNRAADRYRTLWALAPKTADALNAQYGALNTVPLLKQESGGARWTTLDGGRDYVQRRQVTHSDWSLVTVTPPRGIFASRVLGIIITLQMTTLALVYLVGRERWIHDNVQLQKRIELEELARNLDFYAATDPLTGLFNRRKFDRELAIEMLRSQRYRTPLSLALFDVDHFKAINDKHGHQVGDNVLVELSRFVSSHIRTTDVLARWGGEEFVVLTPGVDAERAAQFATNLGAAIRSNIMADIEPITCSFGVTQFEPTDTAETLIARVDEALYRAKINGRDRVEVGLPPMVSGPSLVPTT